MCIVQVKPSGSQDVPSLHGESQERNGTVCERQPVRRPRSQVSERMSFRGKF